MLGGYSFYPSQVAIRNARRVWDPLALAVFRSGKCLIGDMLDGNLGVWSTETGAVLQVLPHHNFQGLFQSISVRLQLVHPRA